MTANLIGGLIIAAILYYVARVIYKKLNPNSNCGSCSTCDQSCPFANDNFDIEVETDKSIGEDDQESSSDIKKEL